MSILGKIKAAFVGTKKNQKEVNQPDLVTVNNSFVTVWRDSVAEGLTPVDLANVLRASCNGDLDAYLTLAEEMEERDMHYSSVLGTRKRAVSGCQLSVSPASDDEKDILVADAVREMFSKIEVYDIIEDLMDAVAKGFSILEINWDTTGVPWWPTPVWRDPHFFQVDRDTLSIFSRKDGSADGAPLSPNKFIVHVHKNKSGVPIRNGLARLVAFGHMCKSYSFKDWMVFMEVFGMPWRVGKYSAGASRDEKDALKRAVVGLGHDAGAIIPDTMQIDFLASGSGSTDGAVFSSIGKEVDAQISKALLGQTMTTDSGSSYAQANVHNLVRKDILTSDIMKIGRTLTNQLVKPFVQLNFGEDVPAPKVVLIPESSDGETLSAWTLAISRMVANGVRIEESQVLERLGIDEPAEGARILTPPVKDLPAGEQRAMNSAGVSDLDSLIEAMTSDWKRQYDPMWAPIVECLNEATTMEEFEERLESVVASGLDSQQLVKRLATGMFMARGLGNGED